MVLIVNSIALGIGLGTSVLVSIAEGRGDDVVAGTRIEFFALAFMAAIASVTGPFIGQNIGVEKKKRVFSGMYTAETYALAVGGLTAAISHTATLSLLRRHFSPEVPAQKHFNNLKSF